MPTGKQGRNGFDSGIYAIINRINGRKYYGSTYWFYQRKHQHWSDLRKNRHRNIHLQRAWSKHGEAAFDFVVVERVPVANLLEAENRYLPFGDYNICRDAERPSNTSHVHRVCEICGKQFTAKKAEARNGRRRFCSRTCYLKKHTKGTQAQVCKRCGKEFVCHAKRLQDNRGKYCSKDCYHPRLSKTAECGCCGKAFEVPIASKRKFCSRECYWKDKTKRHPRPCLTCGNMFPPNKTLSGGSYCSRTCKGIAQRTLTKAELN